MTGGTMTIHPSQVLNHLTTSRAASLGSDRVEVRLMSITICLMFMFQLGEPGSYILFVPGSVTHGVAAAMPVNYAAVGVLFYLNAALLVPLLSLLVFRPDQLRRRGPRQVACLAGIFGAVMWGLMATTSLDVAGTRWLTAIFAARAFADLGLGLLFGVSLNAQQAREAAVELLQRAARQEKEGWRDAKAKPPPPR